MVKEEPKYKNGDIVLYKYFSEIKTGEIVAVITESEMKRGYKYPILSFKYKINREDSEYPTTMEERDVYDILDQETMDLVHYTNAYASVLRKRYHSLVDLAVDILKYPNNNDWRIKQLKSLLTELGIFEYFEHFMNLSQDSKNLIIEQGDVKVWEGKK